MLAFGLLLVPIAFASELQFTSDIQASPDSTNISTGPREYTENDLRAIVEADARIRQISASQMEEVISCESEWDIHAVGDHGHSIGLAQINLPSHPEITKEQAENPEFAIAWMADEWSAGHQRLWTCYRDLY